MTTSLPLDALAPHPDNANRMPDPLFDKLVEHLRDTDRYPPLIVRPFTAPDDPRVTHQLLDGHHRARALQRLGHSTANCEVWPCDDDQALVLLATLNRLQGRDDPTKRGNLLAKLTNTHDLTRLARLLPERREHIKRFLELAAPPPPPAAPESLPDTPVALTFFLPPEDRARLLDHLKSIDPSRNTALMSLIP